jgi:4,5-dihydroxyphthalate decarboxylase
MSSKNKPAGETSAAATSRRDFIKTTAMAVGAIGGLAACERESEAAPDSTLTVSSESSTRLNLTLAGYHVDRVNALVDGRVSVDGCNTRFVTDKIGDLNTHVFNGPQTRDATEIGLHPFMLAYANDEFRDYSLLPIFPLRVFRHKSIFIRNDRGIEKPEDLRGRKIATPGYSSTSLTWIRGIVQDEYGVSPEDIQWVVSAEDSSAKLSGGPSKQENILPDNISVATGPAGQDESDLLESGEVDALFHAAEPRGYIEGHPKIARLFPDFRATERAYFRSTGIFPIMHAVAIKNAVVDQNPWLPAAVFQAYSKSKQMNYEFMAKQAWFKNSLPWYPQELEETRALMGDNFWSYGIEGNRKTLEALFRYSYEQGLAKRELTIEELFHPATLELTESPG